MKCKICGHVFDETKKTENCKGCLVPNCNMIRCPNCGFEQLQKSNTEFKLFQTLKNHLRLKRN